MEIASTGLLPQMWRSHNTETHRIRCKKNPQYKPVCESCGNTNLPQIILGGGAAGGGKSFLGACWLIISCMRFENIRAVVARKTIKSLKESTWNTIKTVLKNWGLKEEVNYRINNLEGTLTFGTTLSLS